MSTGVQQPSARLCFFTAGLLYFESNSYSFYDAYCRGHTASRPERAIGSLWHPHPGGAWKTIPTATLSRLSFIPNTLCHLALSYLHHLEIGGRTPPDSGSGCCHNSLRMSRRTASFLIVPQPILTLHIPSLTSRSPAYHCGHLNWVIGLVVATPKRPLADLAIHYNTLRAAKEQPDVTSYINAYFRLRATGLLNLMVYNKGWEVHLQQWRI